jgi:hypothetical protein
MYMKRLLVAGYLGAALTIDSDLRRFSAEVLRVLQGQAQVNHSTFR